MAGKKLSVFDAFFLAAETREAMMHVGGLLVFTPPADAHPQLLRHLADELRASAAVYAPWNLRLWTPEFLKNPLQAWVEEPAVDLEYHVRRSALPAPGDERELGILVSRLHSVPIDFHRPPWEVHFIEGLEGGRFAMYFKIHHALVDGYTSMKLLARSLADDPDDRDTPMFFARPPRPRVVTEELEVEAVPTFERVLASVRGSLGATREAGRAIMNVVRASRAGDRTLVAPMGAPRTMINRRISRNRRFATQQYPIERMRALARASGGTINDVALAVCGGALRRYLAEHDGLPAEPLTAMLPVNIRPKDDPGGGNAVGAILCTLATDLEEPAARLAAVITSTRRAKEQLSGLSRSAIMQYSAALMAPLAMQQVPTANSWMRPAFNVVVSNVPGPEQPLYFRGARLDALYPLSIPYHGQGLNITINGYAGTINIGFTGCRDAVPSLQRLAVYSGEEVAALEHELAVTAQGGLMALPTVIGRYRVLASLGAGAMGALVRARDERLGRDVAIKRVKNLRGLSAAIFLARFEAEARALAALSHPGVVAVYDSGVDDDVPYLVMELLAGPSLKAALAERGPLPLAEVVAIGIQLARALEAAHARGIVHRDVKPANVVRHADGSWKLVDFGVAHLPDSSVTLTGQFLGTPAYAAPEALATGTTSPRSDVWSLAATLVELATGASARPDATLAEVIAKSARPVIDLALMARLGPLAAVLTPALAIDPKARPDAAMLARSLADAPLTSGASASLPMASASMPIASAPVSLPLAPIAAPPRATTWIGLGVGAVLLIGLIGLGLRCDSEDAGPAPTPSAAPRSGGDDDEPPRFDAPPELDDKAARDWRKLAEKIERGELRAARDKLREFERKHGVSPQSLRLRTWLDASP